MGDVKFSVGTGFSYGYHFDKKYGRVELMITVFYNVIVGLWLG